MVDVLPEKEQILAFEFIKRLVLAWDPDYVRVTPEENERIEQANGEILRGEYTSFASAKELAEYFGVSVD